ncbi:MAG: hypothetical protein PHX62_01500, partial [Bacilli bacterium]|nr:hypothetical protein [Bacilli bacterium]
QVADTVVQTAIGPTVLEPQVEQVLEPVVALQPELEVASDQVEVVGQDLASEKTEEVALQEVLAPEEKVAEVALQEVLAPEEKASEVAPQEVLVPEEKLAEVAPQEGLVTKEKVAKKVEELPISKEEKVIAAKEEAVAGSVVNTLQKLREKIYAQKQLERELMEKEATKVQEKDRVMLDKMGQLIDDSAYDETEDLIIAQEQVESLILESRQQKKKITELETIINKIKSLKIDSVNIIDQDTFEISNDFLLMSSDTIEVNKIIKDIEKELENLTLEHKNTIEKLRDSEVKNKRLKDLYQVQIEDMEVEKRTNLSEINRLSSELINKEKLYQDKLLQEKDKQQANLALIENLEYEKLKLESDISVLEQEIAALKNKLQKRVDSSINTAARMDAMEAEKVLLENKIVQLSKQLIIKERGLSVEDKVEESKAETPYNHILSEIERLKEEVRSLAKNQMPMPQPYPYGYYQESYNCPYNRFFNPGMIPNVAYQPTTVNDELVQEIRNLKQEFQEFKQAKPIVSNVKVETKEEVKPEIVIAEPKVEGKEDNKELNQSLEAHSQQIKEYQEELEKSKAELSLVIERNTEEINKLSESYESQIQAKDNEKNMINAEKDKKIQELQEKIQEKDDLLEKINEEVKRLNEDDIFDPEFKRKIRVIREMRQESEDSMDRDEKEHQKNVAIHKEQINGKNMEIDQISDRIFQLEMNYKQSRDFSSASQNEYEKTKSKYMIEKQLQEQRRKDLEDELTRLNFKYQSSMTTKSAEIEKLNKQEAETVDFFMNKLRRTKTKNLEGSKNERDQLARELEDIRDEYDDEPKKTNPDEIEVDMPFSKPVEQPQDDEEKEDLKEEIRELTRHYNEYYRQITELKAEQDKRIDVEKRLRTNEKTVYDYSASKVNMEECLKSYQEKSRLIEEKQQELSQTSSNSDDRIAQNKIKAEIQEFEVHRNDLRAKIDFYRKQITDLEKQEIVQKYNALLTQMEKIRSVLLEKREQAEAIKVQVQVKTKELENFR